MLGRQHQTKKATPILVAVGGLMGTGVVAGIGLAWLTTLWLGILLVSVLTILLRQAMVGRESSVDFLQTPFYLSHDSEVFDRYQRISQQMLRISQRSSAVYRDLALQRLEMMAADCTTMGQGRIVFTETETWRIAYEQLLRDPTVFFYHSVAIVRHPRYWQDAAGIGSMQLNFQLIDLQIVNIERIAIISDELWPRQEELPVEEVRQWVHEQSTHGIWMRLTRLSDLRNEPDLIRDFGIYGQLAVGTQELSVDHLTTLRFTLNFDVKAIGDSRQLWEKLGVYAIPYKELLDQFHLRC